ncbi:uncharacterized protein LOC116029818 [Ipomoea triloba]|uniref:uncharacterized protein LOC116029818 n=1 Tax=Ipomoea triloba TaxID=35885 RepID=UPI00125CFE56|nr:uncharacterized protein LOC116029818 [Ipomoea triloba]
MWIFAEIPNELYNPEYYKAVEEFMMHGCCGSARKNSPCMLNGRCSKFFPNKYVHNSMLDIDDYPIYCRRDNGRTIKKNDIDLDSRLFVPQTRPLSFHLPNEQSIIFDDGDNVDDVVNRPIVSQSMFIAWFEANMKYEDAKCLTYSEMPRKFVWKKDKREWHPRQRNFTIGRIFYVPPNCGELFYLRCLLNLVRGLKSFEDIKLVDGVHYTSFRDACYARGLIEDDKEYVDAIYEASLWSTIYSLRELFVTLLTSNAMSKSEMVWDAVWIHLVEDVEYHARKCIGIPDLVLIDTQKKNYTLLEIEKLLHGCNKSLGDYPSKSIPDGITNSFFFGNRLVYEELAYDQQALKGEHDVLVGKLTKEQLVIYNKVMLDVDNNKRGLFLSMDMVVPGKPFYGK